MKTEQLNWTAEYSVGLNTVDEQHQRFLSIINNLGQSIADKTTQEKSNEIFFNLIQFADNYLFKEKMLVNSVEELDYSFFREKHRSFLDKLKAFRKQFEEDNSDQLFMELYNYLLGVYPEFINYYTPSLVDILKNKGLD